MSDSSRERIFVADTSGLLGIARSIGPTRDALLQMLAEGRIVVLSCAWSEFSELYEDDAAILAEYVSRKIVLRRALHIGAARIAERLNSGFSRGPYDGNVELYTAAAAEIEGFIIVTSQDQVHEYERMQCNAFNITMAVKAYKARSTTPRK